MAKYPYRTTRCYWTHWMILYIIWMAKYPYRTTCAIVHIEWYYILFVWLNNHTAQHVPLYTLKTIIFHMDDWNTHIAKPSAYPITHQEGALITIKRYHLFTEELCLWIDLLSLLFIHILSNFTCTCTCIVNRHYLYSSPVQY